MKFNNQFDKINYKLGNIESKYSRLFIKNLILFLIAVLLPVLILGSFSIVITQQYIQQNIDRQNDNLLQQICFHVELIFDEIESLQLSFSRNPEINDRLRGILQSSTMTLEDYTVIRSVSNFVKAQADARPYIHSIYVYFNNRHNRFLTTNEGLIVDDKYFDIEWREDYLQRRSQEDMWTSYRRLNPHGFNKNAIDVITLYWVLKRGEIASGVLVMNIYANYIEQVLQNIDTIKNQYILVQDKNGKIIFSNEDLTYLDELDMLYTLKSDKKGVIKTKIVSSMYNWDYYSVVPEQIIYKIPITIRKIVLLLLAILLFLGIIVSYRLTRRNYLRILDIIKIINSAEKGEEMPALLYDIHDEYSYITNRIIKTFLEQKYLKLQLSEKKYRQKTLELLALQAQINPHFLYNTLETIYWKVFQFTGRPNQVNKMLENLSDILKYSLAQPRKTVKLEEEIKHTKNYLEIQKIRYKGKFKVIWEYKKEILKINIIKLVLQPLVENSIYHGIKEKDSSCSLKIKIRLLKDKVKISIIDNGIGIKREHLLKIKDRLDKGQKLNQMVGLYNTNKRLKLLYGEKNGLDIRSKYMLGTVVYFYIPILNK